jgi:hypothetical protein
MPDTFVSGTVAQPGLVLPRASESVGGKTER